MSELAEQLIRKSLETKDPYLDLGNCRLNGTERCLDLLGKCDHLERLSFKNNRDKEFDKDKWLSYKHNRLKKLPKILPPNLVFLNISGIVKRLEDNDLKQQLSTLSQLTQLDLSRNNITDLSFLSSLTQLTALNLSRNDITDLSFLSSLIQLTELNLNNNRIVDLTPLTPLNKLIQLGLGHNKIHDIAPLNELKNLNSLNLSENKIDDSGTFRAFQEHLEVLAQIVETLTDYGGEYKEAAQEFLNNYRLYQQSETRNSLIHIKAPPALLGNPAVGQYSLKLMNPYHPYSRILQYIVSEKAFIYQKTARSYNLTNLKNLQQLNLEGNYLTNFSSILLPKTNLSKLNLEGNFIEKINISEFSQLTYLNLSGNLIKKVNINNCKNLTTLSLGFNHLSQITPTLFNGLPNLAELDLRANPIQNIPQEIYDKDENVLEEVKRFLIAQAQGVTLNTQAKLIWLGNGEVGKTTLSHQLRKNEFQGQIARTHGILIKDWEVSFDELPREIQEKFQTIVQNENQKNALYQMELPTAITLKMWDFGGQEYYHATHRLFLNSNVMYLLVWDTTTNHQDEGQGIHPLEYWRESIQDQAPKNITLEIQNKANNQAMYDWAKLQFKVAHRQEEALDSIAQYDLDTKKLKSGLLHQLSHLEYLGSLFPKVYDDIRQALKVQDKPFLTYDEYRRFCEANDFTEDKIMQHEGQIQTLTQYLHNTGSIICYRFAEALQDKALLRNYVFTQPSWVTTTIYEILAKELLQPRADFHPGEFDLAHVEDVLQTINLTYPLEAKVWLELLLAFELVFQIRKNDKVILVAPQYLPAKCPNQEALEWAIDVDLEHSFTLHFPRFLSKSLFLRFIALYGSQSLLHLYWKNGLCFKLNGKVVYATCNYQKRLIRIEVEQGNLQVARQVYETFFKDQVNHHTQICLGTSPNKFVNLQEAQDKIAKGFSKIDTTKGGFMSLKDFAFLFENTRYDPSKLIVLPIIPNNMNYDLPAPVKEALEKQITEQYQMIVRQRALKNDESNEERRKKYQEEIDLRRRNIDEIKQDFLNQLTSQDQSFSSKEVQQTLDKTIDQLMTQLDSTININPETLSTEPETDKDKILTLIEENIDEALALLDAHFGTSHSMYNTLANEYMNPSRDFTTNGFKSRLKMFVRRNM